MSARISANELPVAPASVHWRASSSSNAPRFAAPASAATRAAWFACSTLIRSVSISARSASVTCESVRLRCSTAERSDWTSLVIAARTRWRSESRVAASNRVPLSRICLWYAAAPIVMPARPSVRTWMIRWSSASRRARCLCSAAANLSALARVLATWSATRAASSPPLSRLRSAVSGSRRAGAPISSRSSTSALTQSSIPIAASSSTWTRVREPWSSTARAPRSRRSRKPAIRLTDRKSAVPRPCSGGHERRFAVDLRSVRSSYGYGARDRSRCRDRRGPREPRGPAPLLERGPGQSALHQRFLELLDHREQGLALRVVELEHDAHPGRFVIGREDRVRHLADERQRVRRAGHRDEHVDLRRLRERLVREQEHALFVDVLRERVRGSLDGAVGHGQPDREPALLA